MKPMYILLAIALVGCSSQSTPAEKEAAKVEVEKEKVAVTIILGKHEDCTVYQTHKPYNATVNWVRCKKEPKVTETEVTEYCGKGCTRKVLTTTIDEEAK